MYVTSLTQIHQLETNVKTGQNLKAKNDELEKLTKEQADKVKQTFVVAYYTHVLYLRILLHRYPI